MKASFPVCCIKPMPCCTESLNCVRLFATPWTAASQAPPSMEIFQARLLEWGAMPFFSRGFCQPRDRTWVSCDAGRYFTTWACREALQCCFIVFWVIQGLEWEHRVGGRLGREEGESVCGLGRGTSALSGMQPQVWRGECGWVPAFTHALSWVDLFRSQPVLLNALLWLGMASLGKAERLERLRGALRWPPRNLFVGLHSFCKTFTTLLTLTTATCSWSCRLTCPHGSAPSLGLTVLSQTRRSGWGTTTC